MINLTEQREGRRALVSPDRDVDGGRADSVRQRGGRHALFCQRRTIHPLTMSLPLCALPPSIASHRIARANAMREVCIRCAQQKLILVRTFGKEERWMELEAKKGWVQRREGGRPSTSIHCTFSPSVALKGRMRKEGQQLGRRAGSHACFVTRPCHARPSARPGMCFYDGNIFAAQRVPSRESQLLYSPPTLPSLCSSTAPSHVPPIDILFHHPLVYEFPTGWRASCNETSP